MQIEFSQIGGVAYLPALQKPVVIDVDALSPDAGDELKRLIEAARFFELPSTVGAPKKGAADYQHDVVTVEDNRRRHTVKILIPSEDVALRELVQAIRKHAKATRMARNTSSGPAAGKPRK
ncbi:hypothetical protein C7T35_37855 [Variovorax sp. WS11]|uniref:protealysin inhibitor emfourin n=1 Tax=Variovorax sp. WS11 TaxID=1105204 RepID=UPI000D0D94A9|nr:protealysin inhibitor emfourin [Variovorax sp. WS11]NDZ17807.1 hypothetical protein [Variovorax sp. WS11]PSL79377.1 hypothetical protein C7T35_37855 [Variovorax sp. WS11]